MASKLKNIQAIKQMLDGTHATQTKIVVPVTERKNIEPTRKVGDIWYDEEGVKYEQKKGYVVRHGKLDDLRKELKTFKNCPKEICSCTNPTRLDLKYKAMLDKCSNCVIEEETKMKINNEYDTYELRKVLENSKSWLREAEQEIELLKKSYSQELSFIQQSGNLEKWNGMPSLEEFSKNLDDEFMKFKTQFIEDLERKIEQNNKTNIPRH